MTLFDKLPLFSLLLFFFFLFFFFYSLIPEKIKNKNIIIFFFTFYIPSIIFYYYSNKKKTHYKLEFFFSLFHKKISNFLLLYIISIAFYSYLKIKNKKKIPSTRVTIQGHGNCGLENDRTIDIEKVIEEFLQTTCMQLFSYKPVNLYAI